MRRAVQEMEAALRRIGAGAIPSTLESPRLDFKQPKATDDETARDLAEAALCFANANGGVIVVGVADKIPGPAALVGTEVDPDFVQRRIYQLTVPPLLVHAEARHEGDARLLVVSVPQGAEIHADSRGRAVRRVGTDCFAMSPAEQASLREERRGVDWTAKPGEQGLGDLVPAALSAARHGLAALADERQRLARLNDHDLLSALGVLTPDGDLLRAAELLFCRGGAAPSPALVYQFRRTPGGEPLDVQRLEGPSVLVLQRAMELIQARRTITPVNLPNGQQLEIADFPQLAVREAVVNALVHRDYHLAGPVVIEHSPEVLVVTSPGPLVSGVTPQNILTHPSKPRNLALAKAARTLGFAEEVGRGVDRMFREMIRSGRQVPRIEAAFDQVRVTLVGGAPNTQIARYVAQMPEYERDDTDTMLVLFHLCGQRTVTAEAIAPLLQKTPEEAEASLRRLASDGLALLEPTRQTVRRARPTYRLRSEPLKALGSAVSYQRRTVDELDRKVIAHVREYGVVTNRTVQNLFDVGLQRARDILRDLVHRKVLRKVSEQERGPGIEYGPGPRFPEARSTRRGGRGSTAPDNQGARSAAKRKTGTRRRDTTTK